eukprot:9362987-Pyramimonas_sp.AAC.1
MGMGGSGRPPRAPRPPFDDRLGATIDQNSNLASMSMAAMARDKWIAELKDDHLRELLSLDTSGPKIGHPA